MTAWRRFTALYAQLLSIVLVLTLALLIVPVTLQIFSRFTHIIPHYIWTEEMARFMFVWVIMIGAMIGVRESAHLEVDLWSAASPRVEAAVKLLANIAVLVVAFVFLWAGWEFTSFAFNRISELAELPLWLIHVAWPLTGLTWVVFLAEPIAQELRVIAGGAE
jgi:TRAP-type C4-dicarboxylate transport system permease small subunit